MENKVITLFIGLILLLNFSLVVAEQHTLKPVTKGECATIPQSHPNATSINITKIRYPDDTENYTVIPMNTTNGYNFYYNFCNTSQVGDYIITTCGDGDGVTTCMDFDFPVTAYGNMESEASAIIYSLLLLFLVGLVIGLVFLNRKIDYEKWHNKIVNQYTNRNYIKLTLSSILYNLMKHSFILYYLLGLPVILVVTDVAYVYNMTNVHTILRSFMIVYVVGLIIVGLMFFGKVQEWLMDLLNKVRDMDWGIER